jgi:ligand-binding SRPBCC domain-containing protein
MPPKTYTLTFQQQVPRGLQEVFSFFARAENLQVITPPWLSFSIISVTPAPIQQGSVIRYKLRFHGIPLGWTSEIVEWEPPHRFVDLQLRGPYKLWRHEHRFEAFAGGTRITDMVTLALPFGLLGNLAYKLKFRSDVQKIFAFRDAKIRQLFG